LGAEIIGIEIHFDLPRSQLASSAHGAKRIEVVQPQNAVSGLDQEAQFLYIIFETILHSVHDAYL